MPVADNKISSSQSRSQPSVFAMPPGISTKHTDHIVLHLVLKNIHVQADSQFELTLFKGQLFLCMCVWIHICVCVCMCITL